MRRNLLIAATAIFVGLISQSCNSSNKKKKEDTEVVSQRTVASSPQSSASGGQSASKTTMSNNPSSTNNSQVVSQSGNKGSHNLLTQNKAYLENEGRQELDEESREELVRRKKGLPSIENEGENEENEEYDGILAAQKHDFDMTHDPSTNTVPKERLLPALARRNVLVAEGKQRIQKIQQTMAAQGVIVPQGTTTTIDATSWVERGSYQDAPGPYGNGRDSIASTSGRIAAFWADLDPSKPNQVFIGGIDGGLWTCPDITVSPAAWTFIDNFSNLAISSICQDPTNANVMYFGTGEKTFNADAVRGGGVWKSTDHGQTWSLLPSTTGLWNVSKILCDKNGYIYVGTISSGAGLQRSTNGGTTWTAITPTIQSTQPATSTAKINTSRVSDFVYDPVRDRMHVYMGYLPTAGSSVIGYVYGKPSTVTSTTWSQPTTPSGMNIDTARSGANLEQMVELAVRDTVVWALRGNASNMVLYESLDTGNTWKLRSTLTASQYGVGQDWYSMGIDCDPTGANIIFGNLNVFRSADSGKTIQQVSRWVAGSSAGPVAQYVHADVHNVYYGSNGRIVVCSDGGVFLSQNGGTNWSDRNIGLRLKQFYSVAIHPSVSDYYLAGAQDNGSHQFTQPGLGKSTEVTGGDGAFAFIDQQNPNNQVTTYVYNAYHISKDGGSTWSSNTFGSSVGQFINPFDYDNATKKIYAAYTAGNYLRWDDPTTTQNTSSTIPVTGISGVLTAVTVSPNLANTVYFAGSSVILKATNANTASPTFTTITPPVTASSYISSIIIGPSTTDQDIIVTSSSYGAKKVFITANGGTTWTEITGNLPDMPVRWALFYPGSNTQAYIATEAGVWYTTAINGTSTVWQPSVGFPAVRTDMIKYSATNNIIAVGTHGRGLWTTKISTTPQIAYYNAQLSQSKAAGATANNCRIYQDYSDTLQISDPPTGAATVTIAVQSGGTAKQGVDYDFTTNGSFTSPSNTVTFASGVYPNKIPITVRVYNNHDKSAAANQPQTANLLLSVSGSTDAVVSASNSTLTLNLTDIFDTATTAKTNQTLWSENWESWPSTSNVWTFNPDLYYASIPNAIGFSPYNGGCTNTQITSTTVQLFTNNSSGDLAYCSNAAAGAYNALFYRKISAGADHYSSMKVSFQYKSIASTAIVNSLVYSTNNGTTWNTLASYATTSPATAAVTANVNIPDSLSYTDFLLGWQSTGSATDTANTARFSIDNIIFTGNINPAPIDSIVGVSQSNYYQSGQNISFASSNNALIANISQSSQDLGCTTASLDSAGTTWQAFSNGLRSQKVISITPSTNGSTASYTVGLYFTAAELGGTAPGTVKIAKSDATNLSAANSSNTTLLATSFVPYGSGYLFTANATGFSKFFLANSSVTLPVTLNSFNGYLDNQGHSTLRWTVGVENNLSSYEVERSYDNIQFASIGSVPATGASSYSFTDPVLALPSNYYRLKIVDVSGKFVYSPIVLVTNNAATEFVKLLGNPVTSQISLLINNKANDNVNASLISTNGQVIKQWNLGKAEGNVILPLNNTPIASGIYILTITAGNQKVDFKIIKR